MLLDFCGDNVTIYNKIGLWVISLLLTNNKHPRRIDGVCVYDSKTNVRLRVMMHNRGCNTRAKQQEQSQVEQRGREIPERIVFEPSEPQHWPFLLWKVKGHSHMQLVCMAAQLRLPLSWSFFTMCAFLCTRLFGRKRTIFIKLVGLLQSEFSFGS